MSLLISIKDYDELAKKCLDLLKMFCLNEFIYMVMCCE
jgi:hypothetical protein